MFGSKKKKTPPKRIARYECAVYEARVWRDDFYIPRAVRIQEPSRIERSRRRRLSCHFVGKQKSWLKCVIRLKLSIGPSDVFLKKKKKRQQKKNTSRSQKRKRRTLE